MSRTISNSDNLIDSRDVIARIDELDTDLRHPWVTDEQFNAWLTEQVNGDTEHSDDANELQILRAFAAEAEGYAGDWRYGATLIRDSYFEDYARDFAEEIGAIKRDASWPNDCIDREQAAAELQQDYSCVSFDGVDYWVRN